MGGRERMPVAYMMCDAGLEGRWVFFSPFLYVLYIHPFQWAYAAMYHRYGSDE